MLGQPQSPEDRGGKKNSCISSSYSTQINPHASARSPVPLRRPRGPPVGLREGVRKIRCGPGETSPVQGTVPVNINNASLKRHGQPASLHHLVPRASGRRPSTPIAVTWLAKLSATFRGRSSRLQFGQQMVQGPSRENDTASRRNYSSMILVIASDEEKQRRAASKIGFCSALFSRQ